MLTENSKVLVPSIPMPRKNRLIIKGRLSIIDIFVFLPFVIIWIALLLSNIFQQMWWVNLLTFVGFIGLGTFLVWPLSMFGKDKLYIYIGRAIKFKIKNQFYQCEKS
ncbi:MAG: hypothetical protein LBS76_00385 [Mycoplasmataceae bacterium]|nr:hypothetical protein [Mycoplasmataceae bacterium]